MKKLIAFFILALLIPLFVNAQVFDTNQVIFPVGQGWVNSDGNPFGNLTASTSPTVNYITATSTIDHSIFPYASTTALSATTLCLTGDTCRTTWPTFTAPASNWNKQTNYGVLTLTPTTTIPVWFKDQVFASSSAIFAGQVTANNFVATGTVSSVFPYASTTALTVSGVNGLTVGSLNGPLQANNGRVSATTSIGVAYGGTGQTSFGQGWLSSDGTTITSSTSPTVNYIIATSTTRASVFPYASTTALSATIICFIGDICRTTWPSGSGSASDWNQQLNFGALALTPTTTIPVWIKGNLYASSTALFTGNVGIGPTTTPISLLSVQGAPTPPLTSLFTIASSGPSIVGSDLGAQTPTQRSSNIFTVLGNGNVGIGTTSPSGTLSVQGIINTRLGGTASSTPPANVFEVYGGTKAFDVGQNIVMQAGAGKGSVTISGGISSNQSNTQDGGPVTINGGDAFDSSATAGSVLIRGGESNPGGFSFAGNVAIRGGTSSFFGGAGNVTIDGGPIGGGSAAGNILLATSQGLVGIGDTTPLALLTVGASDAFQVNTSGRVLANVGASGAGNLAYSFVGDTDNGWYRASADQQRWQTVGTDRLTLDSAGLFGIGTTTPQWPITIFSSTGSQVSLSAGAGIAQWTERNAGGNYYLSTTTIAGNATTTIPALTVIGSSGNMGIGTSSPYARLSVQSGASTGDAFVVATTTNTQVFGVDNDGHKFTSGPTPGLTCNGTGGVSIVGDDQGGTITTNTAATACTLTFSKAIRNTPYVSGVFDNSLVVSPAVTSLSTTAVTISLSGAGLTGGTIWYSFDYHR